jgi:predicted dehydrogenase
METCAKPLRIGVVGTNFVSDWLAEAAALLPQVEVSAVYSRAQATGGAFAQKHGIPQVYTSYEEFLAADTVDAVYIASPNFAHCAQAVAAAKAKKHILCEKVIATNSREFEAMRTAAAENGVLLLEAMRPVYDPALTVLRQALPLVGPLRRVTMEYCQYSSRYDKFLAGEILNAFDPTLSNAAIMDIGVYCIAVCAHLFGAPRAMHAASSFLHNGFEGCGQLLLEYEGFQANISYSKVSESIAPSVFQGEKGSLTIDKISMPGEIWFHPYKGEPRRLEYTPDKNNMVHELAEFARLAAAGAVEHPGLVTSAVQMAVIDEARRQTGIVFPADRA